MNPGGANREVTGLTVVLRNAVLLLPQAKIRNSQKLAQDTSQFRFDGKFLPHEKLLRLTQFMGGFFAPAVQEKFVSQLHLQLKGV